MAKIVHIQDFCQLVQMSFITLSGVVKDRNNNGVSRTVMAFREGINTINTTTSASDGTFSLKIAGSSHDMVTVASIGNDGENGTIKNHLQ